MDSIFRFFFKLPPKKIFWTTLFLLVFLLLIRDYFHEETLEFLTESVSVWFAAGSVFAVIAFSLILLVLSLNAYLTGDKRGTGLFTEKNFTKKEILFAIIVGLVLTTLIMWQLFDGTEYPWNMD